jgi:hypothetical protein
MEQQLLELCRKFIADKRIYCEETIYQTDRVIEGAYEFIEGICNIVGYAPREDD